MISVSSGDLCIFILNDIFTLVIIRVPPSPITRANQENLRGVARFITEEAVGSQLW